MVADVGDGAAEFVFRRRAGDETDSLAARDFQDFAIPLYVRQAERGHTGLFGAEEFSGAAELQVHLRNIKPVGGFHHGADAMAGGVVHFFGDQHAVTLGGAAAHAPAKLMQLREAESLGLLHQHDAGVGDIHAHFDDGGGNQDLDMALFEPLHHGFLLVGAEAAVHQTDRNIGEDFAREVLVLLLRGLDGEGFGLLYKGIDHVRLAAFIDLAFQKAEGLLDLVGGIVPGLDGLAAGREFIDNGYVQIAVERHGKGAGNGSGGHDQDVGGDALLHHAQALKDAEAVLLIDDGEAEFLEFDVIFEQRVSADGYLDQTLCQQFLELGFLAGGEGASEQRGDVPEFTENLFEVDAVLRGQDLGGGKHRDLVAVFNSDDGGFGGDDGFAAAHVALQETVHGTRLFHVVGDFLDHALLRPGGFEWQHGLDALAHAIVDLEGDAGKGAGLGTLESDAALQPEEFFEDEAELRRGAEGVKQAEVAFGRRKVDVANGGPVVGQLQGAAEKLRQVVFDRAERLKDAVGDGAEDAGGEFAGGLIDGDDAAGVQRGLAIVIVARKDFEFGVEHGELAREAVELDLAEEGDLEAIAQHVGEIAAVEPLAEQDGAGGIGEAHFEEAQIAAAETGELGGTDFGYDRGHFAGGQLGDGLHVAAVFVAEGDVAKQVFHGEQRLGFQHGGAGGANSFYEGEWRGEVHAGRGTSVQCHRETNGCSIGGGLVCGLRRGGGFAVGNHRDGYFARSRVYEAAEWRPG